MRTAAAAHRRLGQVHRQLAAADGTAGPADSEEAGGMRVVPSRQGHQVSSFPTRRPSGSAARFMENDAPTSSHAEKSRSLIEKVGKGVLCTMHQELEYPYGSTVNLAADEHGQPFTFVSTMAEHTANLLTSSKCSIVVTEVQGVGDQLAQARMTLVGDMVETEKTDLLKVQFLAQHPEAFYVDFDDFLCMRMAVKNLRYIGGFGEMSWVEPTDYSAAAVDPVAVDADAVEFAVTHMNEDHKEATLSMVQVLGGLPDAMDATVLSFDRYGFDVLAQTAEGPRRTRIGFAEPLSEELPQGPGGERMTRTTQLQMAVVERTRHAREVGGSD
jgi:putative heme iron utilization protein